MATMNVSLDDFDKLLDAVAVTVFRLGIEYIKIVKLIKDKL